MNILLLFFCDTLRKGINFLPNSFAEEKKKAKQRKIEQAMLEAQQSEKVDKSEGCDSDSDEFNEKYESIRIYDSISNYINYKMYVFICMYVYIFQKHFF